MTMANEKILMVMMAVTDMAKAKAFYAEQLGFQVTTDYGQGEQHWVTLEPPGGGPSLTLSTLHGNMRPSHPRRKPMPGVRGMLRLFAELAALYDRRRRRA